MGTVGVVLDTNVVVSGLGFGGRPLEALLRTLEDDVRLLASQETMDELDRVLSYDRLPVTEVERRRLLAILRREAEFVDPGHTLEVARDSDDDKFLEVGSRGGAEYVVSGDDDLLCIGSYRDIRIVTPAEFLEVV